MVRLGQLREDRRLRHSHRDSILIVTTPSTRRTGARAVPSTQAEEQVHFGLHSPRASRRRHQRLRSHGTAVFEDPARDRERATAGLLARPTATRLWNPVNASPRRSFVARALAWNPRSDLSPREQGQRPVRAAATKDNATGRELKKKQQREEYPLLPLRNPPQPKAARVSRELPRDLDTIALPTGTRTSDIPIAKGKGKAKMDEKTEQAEAQTTDPQHQGSATVPNETPVQPQAVHLADSAKQQQRQRKSADIDLEQGLKPVPSQPSLRSSISRHHSYTSSQSHSPPAYSWGPAHPCFPHLNPHVPTSSSLYTSTRIIRVQRDWFQAGDLAPQYSNLYPEILDPLLSEQDFRQVISRVNADLLRIFSPTGAHNWADLLLGAVTGWLWDDTGLTGAKRKLEGVERWLEEWNRDVGAKDGVKIWPLRRTAYMTLDIQIPDPQIGVDDPETDEEEAEEERAEAEAN